MSNLNGEGIITQVHKYVVKGQKKKLEEQDSYRIAYLKLRNLLEKNLLLFIVLLMKI